MTLPRELEGAKVPAPHFENDIGSPCVTDDSLRDKAVKTANVVCFIFYL